MMSFNPFFTYNEAYYRSNLNVVFEAHLYDLLPDQFSIFRCGGRVLATNKLPPISSEKVWLSVPDLFLVLFLPVPEEKG